MANNQITGMGIISPIGIGVNSFAEGLRKNKSNFSIEEFNIGGAVYKYPVGKTENFILGDVIADLNIGSTIMSNTKRLRNLSRSSIYSVYCALEAWSDASFDSDLDMSRVALISAGSNTQEYTKFNVQNEYREKIHFLNPNYGLNFFDTDIIGVLTELLGIRGEGHLIGAASASGNMAIIQGLRLIDTCEYDVVIIVAPLMDLSIFEYQGFTALGAMAKLSAVSDNADICNPFNKDHCGFVYGQSSACLILESEIHAVRRGKQGYGSVEGYGISMDANRNPNPTVEGEKRAMRKAMSDAGINPFDIDYVNTHGTGSPIGDRTEVEAILSVGLKGVKINSTKSLIGHALTAAGLVESVASLIQMKDSFIHGNKNLTDPISDALDWVKSCNCNSELKYILNNSFGFGGISTSIILKK